MSDEPHVAARRPERRRRWTIAAIGVAVTAAILFGLAVLTGPARLKTDQVLREYGTYVSPSNQMITVGFASRSPWLSILDRFVNRKRARQVARFTEFEVERDWFLCIDEYDRLWLFTGRRDPAMKARKTSSGGTKPRVQSVMMSGFFLHGSRVLGGDMVVTGIGDWRGCPRQFFEQIPHKGDPSVAIWGENPPIPEDPPEFTPAERAAIAAFLRQREIARNAASRRMLWRIPDPVSD